MFATRFFRKDSGEYQLIDTAIFRGNNPQTERCILFLKLGVLYSRHLSGEP